MHSFLATYTFKFKTTHALKATRKRK